LLAVLHDDRPAPRAPVHRHRARAVLRLALPRPRRLRPRDANRDHRPVLALRRHRLDLPVPASLPRLPRMKASPLRGYIATWIALLVLLALTCASSYLPLGRFNLLANVAIAVAKAMLVVVFFMKLLKAGPVVRLTALAGVAWLSLLVILSFNDF